MVEKETIKVQDKLTYHCAKLKQDISFKKEGDEYVEKIEITKGLIDHTTGNDPDFIKKCKFLMVGTMHNEEPLLFNRNMLAIHKNIQALLIDGCLSLNNIAVLVVVDGIESFYKGIEKLKRENDLIKDYSYSIFPINSIYDYLGIKQNIQSFKALLNEKFFIEKSDRLKSLRNIQRNNSPNLIIKNKGEVKDRYDEFTHFFKCQAKFDLNSDYHINLLFTVKQQNKRKLNSHLWFCGRFFYESKPDYCMLIGVGTESEPRALYLLFRALELDAQIVGACVEIVLESENDSVFNILCYAQKVEYKFLHIPDKALEIIIEQIIILPGAFSANRYSALQPQNLNVPLWGDYFKSILNPEIMNCYHANIYMAEDRGLCLSLVSAEVQGYLLRYKRESLAHIDLSDCIEQLMNTRRSWINAYRFALFNFVKDCKMILNYILIPVRKLIIMFQMLYCIINIIYSIVIIGATWFALNVCIRRLFGRPDNGEVNTESDLNFIVSGILIGYASVVVNINYLTWE